MSRGEIQSHSKGSSLLFDKGWVHLIPRMIYLLISKSNEWNKGQIHVWVKSSLV